MRTTNQSYTRQPTLSVEHSPTDETAASDPVPPQRRNVRRPSARPLKRKSSSTPVPPMRNGPMSNGTMPPTMQNIQRAANRPANPSNGFSSPSPASSTMYGPTPRTIRNVNMVADHSPQPSTNCISSTPSPSMVNRSMSPTMPNVDGVANHHNDHPMSYFSSVPASGMVNDTKPLMTSHVDRAANHPNQALESYSSPTPALPMVNMSGQVYALSFPGHTKHSVLPSISNMEPGKDCPTNNALQVHPQNVLQSTPSDDQSNRLDSSPPGQSSLPRKKGPPARIDPPPPPPAAEAQANHAFSYGHGLPPSAGFGDYSGLNTGSWPPSALLGEDLYLPTSAGMLPSPVHPPFSFKPSNARFYALDTSPYHHQITGMSPHGASRYHTANPMRHSGAATPEHTNRSQHLDDAAPVGEKRKRERGAPSPQLHSPLLSPLGGALHSQDQSSHDQTEKDHHPAKRAKLDYLVQSDS